MTWTLESNRPGAGLYTRGRPSTTPVRSTSGSLAMSAYRAAEERPEFDADTRKSSDRAACRNRGYAVSVRRAPAAAVSATPPAMPISTTMSNEDVHRPRSSALARIQMAVTSLAPHDRRRLQAGRDPPGEEGEEVG